MSSSQDGMHQNLPHPRRMSLVLENKKCGHFPSRSRKGPPRAFTPVAPGWLALAQSAAHTAARLCAGGGRARAIAKGARARTKRCRASPALQAVRLRPRVARLTRMFSERRWGARGGTRRARARGGEGLHGAPPSKTCCCELALIDGADKAALRTECRDYNLDIEPT